MPRVSRPPVADRVPGRHERLDLPVLPCARRQPRREVCEPFTEPNQGPRLLRSRVQVRQPPVGFDEGVEVGAAPDGADPSIPVACLDLAPAETLLADVITIAIEQPRRDELELHELDALSREALLKKAGRDSVHAIRSVLPTRDDSSVGIHPHLVNGHEALRKASPRPRVELEQELAVLRRAK